MLRRCDHDPDQVQLAFRVSARTGEIPAGFVFDGASVPRWLWWLIGHPLTPRFWRATARHDWHYRTQDASRHLADLWMRWDLLADGAGHTRAWAMFYAVRLFGGRAYGRPLRR